MSPFRSKSQQRAAFSGALGPEMKKKAKLWAKHTPNIEDLPEHADAKKSLSEWKVEVMSLDKAYDLVKGRGKDRVKRKRRALVRWQGADATRLGKLRMKAERKSIHRPKKTMADMPGRIPGYSLG